MTGFVTVNWRQNAATKQAADMSEDAMTMRLCGLVGALALGLGASAASAASPVGVWIDDTGRGAVEISDCGDGKVCGRLIWLQDTKNAKACGTEIIGAASKAGDSWDNGWIYSPEKKSKYDVELTPVGEDKLRVLGYLGTKLFSKEMIWTRAPADLKRCDLVEAKAAPAAPGANATAAVAAAPPAPAATTDEAAKAEQSDGAKASRRTQTAQADADTAEPAPRPRKAERVARKQPKRYAERTCRVRAPFVTVTFKCDGRDDDD